MEITQNLRNIKKKKKGFTLIELMIVLAIIAILAIVLIPKAAIFKNQSKNAGVVTNVNTVRGYLETKISNDGGSASYLSVDELNNAINSSFSDDKLVNPFGKTLDAITVEAGSSTSIDEASAKSGITNSSKGKVIVDVYSGGYAVYGVNSDGSTTPVLKVK